MSKHMISKYAGRASNWYSNLWPKPYMKPPYYHVAQVGDPRLRTKSESIPLSAIATQNTRELVAALKEVMEAYQCVGLAAPQIGINQRIFVMEMNQNHLKSFSEEDIKRKEMYAFPLMVFINPTMKVLDPKKLIHEEACESVKGFCAHVARFKEVQIDGYNEEGRETSITFNGWASRIAQHEMDHLNGVVYVDKMEKNTFCCQFWDQVNINQGFIKLPFSPD